MKNPVVITRNECDALGQRIFSRLTVPTAQVTLRNSARASVAFVRGDAHMASETQSVTVELLADRDRRSGVVRTNQLDDAGLDALVREAERLLKDASPSERALPLLPSQRYLDGPPIYSATTVAAQAADAQNDIFRRATDAAEAAGLIAAGDVSLEAQVRWVRNTQGLTAYERTTYGEFSLTARTKDGTGSGWGWGGYEDWGRVDVDAVIQRAVDLGRRSAAPVAVEPGRYTVILEPTAVANLIEPITFEWGANSADHGQTVFSKEPPGTNKIGLQMIDRRLRMVSSPWDPERPASTVGEDWSPILAPVTWFKEGVLRNLEYYPSYARMMGREPLINPGGLRLEVDGPTTTLEEMIASTKRGIWINRLSHTAIMNRRTLLLTGVTRDGTFLIENGKITKPIKNFRFTESPFFVLNRLEAWGDPVRASSVVIAPRLKLGGFNFTSITDAV